MKFIDTHTHLDFPRFNDDRKAVIARARREGVECIVNIGADLSSSHRSLELARNYDFIYAAAGVHPHNASDYDDKTHQVLKDITKSDRVVAVGEIGLDFHYDNSPRSKQKEVFRAQLKLARETGLPVVIHSREADRETLDILKEEGVENGGIFHCFSGNYTLAREIIALDLKLGIGGVLTFNNAVNLQQTMKKVAPEHIVLETDCPYLTPHPHRGRRNEPSYVKYVARKLADIRGSSPEEIAHITSAGAREVYSLK